ncbi:restriction endonuclease subunit S, partial [Macrococcus capreoli]
KSDIKELEFLMENLFVSENQDLPKIINIVYDNNWRKMKLSDIGDTYTGISGKSKDDFGHGDAWYITYLNVFNNAIADFNLKEKIEVDIKQNEVKYGDVLFTTSSETPDEVGMSSVWLGTESNIYLNSFCFGFRPKIEIDPYFLAYLLRNKNVRKKISKLAQGISRYNISKVKLMDIEVHIPEIEEQKEIGLIINKQYQLIKLKEKEIQNLINTKAAFLQKLFPKG